MLLALDTSTRILGIALYDGVFVTHEAVWFSQNHHSVELAPAVSQALERAMIETADLQVIGVALGPGSFTSLRVGLAFAKGLALSRHIPLIGVSSLDVVACAQPLKKTPLIAVLEAGRGRLAAGWYQAEKGAWQASGEVEILTPKSLSQRIRRPITICGELSAETRRILGRKYKTVQLASPAFAARRPSFLAELAWKRWQAGQVDDPIKLAPVYLHTRQGEQK